MFLGEILSHFKILKMENFQKLLIKEYKYWKVLLHHNQCYLGRCVVWCKRENVIDFFDMDKEEKKEFWDISKNLREVIQKIFKPDLFNYSSLANRTPHLHVHVIPRYKEKRIFENFTFADKRWGKNPYPYNKNFKISDNIISEIRKIIYQNII